MGFIRSIAKVFGFLRLPLILLTQLFLLLIALDYFLGLGATPHGHPVFSFIQSYATLIGPASQPLITDTTGNVVLTTTYRPFWEQGWVWIVIAILPVLSWIIALLGTSRRPQAYQVRTSSGETILIHPAAIANFASARIDDHPAVTWHSVRVSQQGGRQIAIRARVKLAANHNWVETNRQIENSIREGFAQVMGIEKIDRITLILDQDRKDMVVRPGPAGRPDAAPEPPVKAPLERDREDPLAGDDDKDASVDSPR